MFPRRTSLLVFAALVATRAACAQPSKPLGFNAGTDSVTAFAQIPMRAIALLETDQEEFPEGSLQDLHCLSHEEEPSSESSEPHAQILCRTIPLSSLGGTNYLVIGVGALRRAHTIPFWIFHQQGPNVWLLFKVRSDAIAILAKNSNGFREIESTWVQQAGKIILTTRYRFNGNSYVPSSSHRSKN